MIAENGKIILSKNYTGGNIIYDRYNLKEFNAGWYIIKIQTGNEVKTTKFLLIK
ncbi:MAG: T9SS type A sorting domain-containing protein [Bacteroidales bacterium]|nr:T9SS type A sorting domain-containing protein [Bacteroidales bacterium]